MKLAIKIAAIVALLLVGALYLQYGTLSPCGMLQQKTSQEDELAGHLPDSLVEMGLKMKHGPLTPGKCLKLLINPDADVQGEHGKE